MEQSNQPPHHPPPPTTLESANRQDANGIPAWVEVVRPSADRDYRVPYPSNSRYGYDTEDDAGTGGGLLEYWRILRRHKKTILFAALGGLILGVAIGVPMTPIFRARTSLEVLSINEDFMNLKQSSPVNTVDNSFEISEEQTQAKLLEGEALHERVMNRLDPSHRAGAKVPSMATSGWRAWLHLKEAPKTTEREKLLSKVSDSLKIRPTARTRVLEVTADSKDPKLASDFLNTLIEEFTQQSVEARLNSTNSTGEWLRREIDDARQNLQRSEDALQAYARQSGLIFTDENTNVATEKLQQVQQQLSTATADRIAKQSHFELAKNSPPDALGDVLNDDALRESAAKLGDLRSQVASLSAVFTPAYSKLRQTQAQLLTVQADFAEARADVITHVENDYHEAARREELLANTYDAQARDVIGQDEKAIQYNILKREVDSSRQLYDTMLQETKQASIASAMRSSNVRVVDPAGLPDTPVFPNFKLNAGLGMFVGLLFGITIATVRERADCTLQQPGDIKLWTDLQELGTIPVASAARVSYARPKSSPLGLDSAPSEVQKMLPRSNPDEIALMTWRNKAGIVAEAFRCTLTSILFIGENGNRPRVFVITSANPGEGKTTVVSNIALATAEIRHKVLVIDADLRRPRMHDIYDVPNERGLSDVLREELSEESLSGLVHQTSVPNLHVLPAGPPTQAAAHLLYSPNFGALINKFRNEYDMILIDAPPMLQMTDARVAGRLADGVVLVSRAGKTTRDALLAVRDRFLEDRIRILGTVLNDWNPKKAPGGYYGYGGNYKTYKQYLKT